MEESINHIIEKSSKIIPSLLKGDFPSLKFVKINFDDTIKVVFLYSSQPNEHENSLIEEIEDEISSSSINNQKIDFICEYASNADFYREDYITIYSREE